MERPCLTDFLELFCVGGFGRTCNGADVGVFNFLPRGELLGPEKDRLQRGASHVQRWRHRMQFQQPTMLEMVQEQFCVAIGSF